MNKSIKYLLSLLILCSFTSASASDNYPLSDDSLIVIGKPTYYNSRKEYNTRGFNLFLGYGYLNGNISSYITNPLFLGFNLEFIKKKIVFQIDDYVGFGSTKKTMVFPDGQKWYDNSVLIDVMGGGNLGYKLIDSREFEFVPLAGIGVNILNPIMLGASKSPTNMPVIFYYKIGYYIVIKDLNLFKHNLNSNIADSFRDVRLSCGFNCPIIKPKHEDLFNGNMFYLTLGMGIEE